MKQFKAFIDEEVTPVTYKKPNPQRLSDEEHNENVVQSNAIKSGHMSDVHPVIASAIHKFAKDKDSFTAALSSSKIEKIKPLFSKTGKTKKME
jgi:hypothetical protein